MNFEETPKKNDQSISQEENQGNQNLNAAKIVLQKSTLTKNDSDNDLPPENLSPSSLKIDSPDHLSPKTNEKLIINSPSQIPLNQTSFQQNHASVRNTQDHINQKHPQIQQDSDLHILSQQIQSQPISTNLPNSSSIQQIIYSIPHQGDISSQAQIRSPNQQISSETPPQTPVGTNPPNDQAKNSTENINFENVVNKLNSYKETNSSKLNSDNQLTLDSHQIGLEPPNQIKALSPQFRTVMAIHNFFQNKYSIPQILLSIHQSAGDIKLAIANLLTESPNGEIKNILSDTLLDADPDKRRRYFS